MGEDGIRNGEIKGGEEGGGRVGVSEGGKKALPMIMETLDLASAAGLLECHHHHPTFGSQQYSSVDGGGGLFVSDPFLIEKTRCREVEMYREMSKGGLNTARDGITAYPPSDSVY